MNINLGHFKEMLLVSSHCPPRKFQRSVQGECTGLKNNQTKSNEDLFTCFVVTNGILTFNIR